MTGRGAYRRERFPEGGGGDVDPMSSVSNLADIMLIFAVGVLIALIAHWNVDMTVAGDNEDASAEPVIDLTDAETFTEDEQEAMREGAFVGDTGNLRKTGEVYYDESTGTFYIVETEN